MVHEFHKGDFTVDFVLKLWCEIEFRFLDDFDGCRSPSIVPTGDPNLSTCT
jgi:hypothetical protein